LIIRFAEALAEETHAKGRNYLLVHALIFTGFPAGTKF